MQNCKSIVTMVYECYFYNQLLHCIHRYGLHYNVLLQMIMSVLQEVKGLTNYTSSRKTSFDIKFQAQCLHGLPVLT